MTTELNYKWTPYNGQIVNDVVVNLNGWLIVQPKTVIQNVVVNNYGLIDLSGTLKNVTINQTNRTNNLSIRINASSARLIDVTMNAGSYLTLDQGNIAGNITVDGATLIVSKSGSIGGVTADNTKLVVTNKGLLDITGINAIYEPTQIYIENGSSVNVMTGKAVTLNLVGDDNYIYVNSNLTNDNPISVLNFTQGNHIQINGWGYNNNIEMKNVDPSGKASNDYISVVQDGKVRLSIYVPGIGDNFTFFQNTMNNTLMITSTLEGGPCFLTGSMIKTPNGDVAVEDIQIGDEVTVFDWKNNVDTTAAIKWVGSTETTVNQFQQYDDRAGYPVRIMKNAIAEGVPYKDLLVTSEHCIFFEDKFVPVRMLVNGASISYDKTITSYTYYHIETENHSVIYADGMLTESYLDTGNRNTFKQHGNIAMINAKNIKSWENDASAQLTVDRPTIEPIYNQIAQRAKDLGIIHKDKTVNLTADSDLHLVTETGSVIRAQAYSQGRFTFILPDNVNNVYLASKTSRPCDIMGSFVDDRRELGVLVGEIFVISNNTVDKLTDHLSVSDLAGWDIIEQSPYRWTNGYALLNVHQNKPKPRALIIQVLSTSLYPIDQNEGEIEIKKIA